MSYRTEYSQIDSKSKYLVALANGTGFTPSQLRTAVTGNAAVLQYTGTLLNTTNASAFVQSVATTAVTNGLSYRYMGQQLVIQSMGQDVYRFRLVQPVNGPTVEGVPVNYATASFYVCVWSADPSVKVVAVAYSG